MTRTVRRTKALQPDSQQPGSALISRDFEGFHTRFRSTDLIGIESDKLYVKGRQDWLNKRLKDCRCALRLFAFGICQPDELPRHSQSPRGKGRKP